MTLIKRFLTIVKANLHSLANKGGNPSKTLVLVSEKLRMDIVKAKRKAVESIAREKVLFKELSQQKESVHKWGLRAEDAVKSEQDDLAKEALMEKANAVKRYGELSRQYESLSDSNTRLKQTLRGMELKESQLQDNVSEMHTKITTTQARSVARRVKTDASEMQRKLENVQDEIDIMAECITVHEEIDLELDSVENGFMQLDDQNAEVSVEEELLKLKEDIHKTTENSPELLLPEEKE